MDRKVSISLFIAANFDDGRLVARANDNAVVARIVADGVNMRPVAARAGARDIAEGLFCKLLFGHDLTGMFGIDAQTYRP